jgi:glycosyltransferase involved in cell wall biosynthesis
MLEAGHPNLTLMEAASACVPIIGTYRGTQHIYGMWVIPEPSTQNVIHGIEQTILTYKHRRNEMFEVRDSLSWDIVAKKLSQYYELVHSIKDNNSERVKELYLENYNNL